MKTEGQGILRNAAKRHKKVLMNNNRDCEEWEMRKNNEKNMKVVSKRKIIEGWKTKFEKKKQNMNEK